MQNYPIFVDLKDQACLVVGGGPVALRKIRLMISAGAKITIVAPEVCADLKQEFGSAVQHHARPFKDDDIIGYRLITAATNQRLVNKHLRTRSSRQHSSQRS